MKSIGQVISILIIGLVLAGTVYMGVISVLQKAQYGKAEFAENLLLENAEVAQQKEIEHSIKSVTWKIEEWISHEAEVMKQADGILSEMSLEQKLAQMMILTNEHDITKENLYTYQPGGIIFFGVDFDGKTVKEVAQRVDRLQSYVQIPLFVGVDEEGGAVSRVSGLAETDLPEFLSARNLYPKGTESMEVDTKTKMQLLKSMGINLNFNPVADVVDKGSSYMYPRAASGDAKEVAEYVKTVLAVMQEEQVIGCIKHFPGYGNNVNTHNQLARDSRTLSEYEQRDFIPFQAGIDAGADMVMVSHIIMETMDRQNPASLSEPVHDILRKDLEFHGVIIADDLNMQAILATMTIEEATAKAFRAGNDMIFSADFVASMKGALAAVEQGLLTEEQIDESVRRVLRVKIENGMISSLR